MRGKSSPEPPESSGIKNLQLYFKTLTAISCANVNRNDFGDKRHFFRNLRMVRTIYEEFEGKKEVFEFLFLARGIVQTRL